MFDLHETLSSLGYGEPWMSPATWGHLDAKTMRHHGISLVRKSRAKWSYERVPRVPAPRQPRSVECKKYYVTHAEKLRAKRRERYAALSPTEKRAVNLANRLSRILRQGKPQRYSSKKVT